MRALAFAIALVAIARPATAQTDADPPHAPGIIGAPAGTGPFPAVAVVDASLPSHTLYRPAVLPRQRLPIVLWGNGGCRDNGLRYSQFLREIASHGYFVVAVGHARSERPVKPVPAAVPTPPEPVAFNGPGAGEDETRTSQLIDGLDWAIAENRRAGSPYRGRLDPARVAVMGHSCGGLQAIEASADPRVRASIIWNSGTYERNGAGARKGVQIGSEARARIHAPIAYINGGPSDIAYRGALGDFENLPAVPALFAWLPYGHPGTFEVANGGDYGRAGVAWLDWWLKRDRTARAMFVGPNCGLCRDPRWTLRGKNLR